MLLFLYNHFQYLIFEIESNILSFLHTVDLDRLLLVTVEYYIVAIYNLCLCFSDECFFILAGHLFTIWGIDERIDEVESEEGSFCFCFFSLFEEFLFLFPGSLCQTSE